MFEPTLHGLYAETLYSPSIKYGKYASKLLSLSKNPVSPHERPVVGSK